MKREGGLSECREPDILGTYGGVSGLAEEDRAGLRAGGHGPYVRIVRVQYGDAALVGGGQRLDQLALGLGDLLAAAELADVRGADVEHHADPRRVSSAR